MDESQNNAEWLNETKIKVCVCVCVCVCFHLYQILKGSSTVTESKSVVA